jgi:large subunit ribosomal protein L28
MISYLSMSSGMKCANCGKGVMYGHNVSHAKNRTKRLFKPNLHSARIVIDGIGKRVRLCTKCLRRYKKNSVKEKVPQPVMLQAITV